MHVRIFTYIRNEQLLLEDWLNHHAEIVPWWAIHVVDNNSDDDTASILQQYKDDKGINVYTHDDYKQKGQYLSELMSRYSEQDGLLIPIDGDEFMVMYKNNHITSTGWRIHDYLHGLPRNGSMYSTRGNLDSIPEHENVTDPLSQIDKFQWRWVSQKMCKKFYHNKTFKSTDHGNHHGTCNNNKNYIPTDIAYLHYSNTGPVHYKARCEMDIESLDIQLNVIKQQLAERGEDAVKSMGNYVGRDKVNAYLNINNWTYEPVSEFDVKFKFK